MIDERRMNDIGTSTMEANAQTSIPIVDVMLPSGKGDHLTISQVNLSISGYEPDLLRISHMRSLSMRAQEISMMPQLDGPGSLPMTDPIGGRTHEISRPAEQESSQGDMYIQRTTTTRGREYREEESDNDGSRRTCRSQRHPDEGRYPDQGGRPPDQGGHPDRRPPGGGCPHRDGRPLEEKDTWWRTP